MSLLINTGLGAITSHFTTCPNEIMWMGFLVLVVYIFWHCLSLVLTSNASISTMTYASTDSPSRLVSPFLLEKNKTFNRPWRTICACVCCCAYACVASENQALSIICLFYVWLFLNNYLVAKKHGWILDTNTMLLNPKKPGTVLYDKGSMFLGLEAWFFVLCHTMLTPYNMGLHNVSSCDGTPHSTMPHNTLYHTTPYFMTPHQTMPCQATPW